MRNRKISIPKKISGDTSYVFGIKSTVLNSGSKNTPAKDSSETDSNIKSVF